MNLGLSSREETMGLTKKVNAEEKSHFVDSPTASAYYESARRHGDETIELDAIERLKSNIIMLDDLQNRLRFMNNELETLLGTRKKKN